MGRAMGAQNNVRRNRICQQKLMNALWSYTEASIFIAAQIAVRARPDQNFIVPRTFRLIFH
jgi:hypothetical protein